MELTEVEFWEKYWQNCQLPAEVDFELAFDRCLSQSILANMPKVSGEVFEIGCAPGKWLAYMAKTFSLIPSGLEYSYAGMKATKRNFDLLGLTGGEVYSGDFFELQPEKQFDVVMSFGFIEHFTNVDEVVDRHLKWLKPGGVLILAIPNFNGVYRGIQRVLDKDILDKHNLDIMNLDYFNSLEQRFPLKPIYIDYVGSFEPSLPIAKHKYGNPLQIATKIILKTSQIIRKFKYFDSLNNRYISSCLLSIYKKVDN